VILFLSIPLAHAAPVPGIPVLYFESKGGPYVSGQTAQIQFVVENQGSDQINGLTLSVRAGQGWSALSGSINIGTLSSGETRNFQVQVVVGSATIPSLIFSATSTDHIALDFPVSILVARGVTPQVIANEGEAANALMSLIDQGVTYTVYQIGSLLFPTAAQGITSSSDLQQLLQGYFTREYLMKDNQGIASSISSLTNALSSVTSNAASASAAAYQGYTLSIPLLLGTYTYSGNLYAFLTWAIPVSQWIPGAQDVRIADLLARAASQLGVNISGDDIIAFANLLSGIGSAQSLGRYLADLQRYDQLIGGLVSNTIPDLAALLNALNSANTILTEIQSVINTVNQFLSSFAQRIQTWIAQLEQVLSRVFASMEAWVSQNLSLVASAINSFLTWLYNASTSALNYVYNVIQGFLQAQNASQSAQSNVSAMTSSVPESSNSAWGALSERLNQVAGKMQQQFNGFCSQYESVPGNVKTIIEWGALTGLGFLNPQAASGLFLIKNGVDIGCSYSVGSSIDPVQIISFAGGASGLLGDIFPKEESDFGAISKMLTFFATAVPVAEQLKTALGSSKYDLSGISALISNYQSATNEASAAFHQANPDCAATLGAIASLSNLPSIDAVNSVLQDIQSCSGAMNKLAGYEQEGMVAPDLDDQAKTCQQTGQSAISKILSLAYSAVSDAASLPSFASKFDSALEARHQQFIAAKQARDNLISAASSLTSCGFMWVQPDPNAVNQVNQALQQTQSQYNDGRYSDVLSTASQDEIARAKSASEACSNSASQAKLELAGVGGIGIISIVAVGVTIHRRETGTEETENLQEARHDLGSDLSQSGSQRSAGSTQARPRGSIGLGAFVGFLLLIFLGFIPILGALIAGLVAGLIARGAGRGAAAGFVAGIVGAVVVALLLTVGGAAIGGLFGLAGLGGLLGGLVGGAGVLLSLGNAIVCLIGGLIGGALRRG
jgi:hypothetical protein